MFLSGLECTFLLYYQVTLLGGMLEGVDPLPLTPLEDVDPVLKTQKLTARLTALSAFLQAMLV